MNQMSTGDQSEYLRKKMAERRSRFEQGGQFMRSGFQRWAENERPARQGGAAKEPLATASMKAGKDILDRVKSLGEDMFAQYYKGSARHIKGENEEESDSEGEDMEGGAMAANLLMKEGRGYSGNAMPHFEVQFEDCPTGYIDDGLLCRKPLKWDAKKGTMDGGEVIPKKRKGKGKLSEHAADLLKMSKGISHKMPDGSMMPGLTHKKGKGRMDCEHHEEGEGTHVRKVGGRLGQTVATGLLTKKGKGFKEGVDESVRTVGAIGDAAKYGYDAYEAGKKGNVLAGLDAAKGVYSAGQTAKTHATKAAQEFGVTGSGRASRAALVKKIMKEKGLSLPAASKYVKDHGLYKK